MKKKYITMRNNFRKSQIKISVINKKNKINYKNL